MSDAGWSEFGEVATLLGYKRGASPDFGEVDVVDVRELAAATVALADLVAGATCCDGDGARWTPEARAAVGRLVKARAVR